MMREAIANTLKSIDGLKSQFKRVNNEVSLLPKWRDKMSEIEGEATKLMNSIYHSLEVKDYSGSEKTKIMKMLEGALRERRAAKKAREAIEIFISVFESHDIKYKPFANDDLDKKLSTLNSKHAHIEGKSKSSAKEILNMIREGE